MESDEIEAISASKIISYPHEVTAHPDMIGTSLLEVRDGSSHAPQFMNYSEEPPPAPQIHSKGVVATNITEHFTKATESVYFASGRDMIPVADQCRARCWPAD